MKKKQVLKVMGMVLAGSLVLSEAAPVSVRAASAAAQSSQEQESREEQETAIVCYIDTKNGNDKNDGMTPETAVKTLKQALTLYQEMKASGSGETETEAADTVVSVETSVAETSESDTKGYFVFCGMTESELKTWIENKEESLGKGEALFPQGTDAVTEDAYKILAAQQQARPTATPVPGSVPSPDGSASGIVPVPGTTPVPENPSQETENDETSGSEQVTPVPTETPESTVTPTPTETPENTATPTPTETPENTATPTPTETPESTPAPTPTETPESTPTESPAQDPEEETETAPTPGEGSVNNGPEAGEPEDPETDTEDDGQGSSELPENGQTDQKEEQPENSGGDSSDDTDVEDGSGDTENAPGTAEDGSGNAENASGTTGNGSGTEKPGNEDSLMNGHLEDQAPASNDALLNGSLHEQKEMIMSAVSLFSLPETSDDPEVLTGNGGSADPGTDSQADDPEADDGSGSGWSEEEERLLAGAADSAPSAVQMAAGADDLGIMLVKAPGTMIVGPDNYDKKPSSTQQSGSTQNTQNSGSADSAVSSQTPAATKAPETTKNASGSQSPASTGTPQKKTDTAVSVKTNPVQTGDTAMILPFSISTVLSGLVVAMFSALHIQNRRKEKDLAWQRFRQENPLDGEKK